MRGDKPVVNQQLSYDVSGTQKGHWVTRLTGMTKILVLLSLSIIGMVSYDTWYLVALTIFAITFYQSAHLRWHQVRGLLYAIAAFTALNLVLVYVFNPAYGSQIYGTSHVLVGHGFFVLTWEELFYLLNMLLKYVFIVPLILAFLFTTNPSELASGMNRIGFSYKISYAVELSLRYIPDVIRDFKQISLAQQARGLEMSRKAGMWKRLKRSTQILIPLVFSSMDKIEVTTRAMKLRRFGTNKHRTWYMTQKLAKIDYLILIVTVVLIMIGIGLFWVDGGRFYNPFR
ncbi:MAG: energy-coupling factor transporter transmembrane component T [Lentilactobacillus hilgardii]|jgi:energy-coupling factor transport system permease protein|uniref:Energy-coupling factor transporter transmembrane protein EcfT n=1 Tax=Lentilactobacillus hilgardii TaxID=1588 RepID=A0A6P1E9L5_LENHI|nr:energy-coupling factor transporter transmembrane component T [Lentilactobacillus hilgardii]RRG11478.1 MAG: energy-coupling factor transporter transmembrane protein EcfT [Lactobacillus sp.]EEI72320.1 cobalt transport protein [Lentilactobacillus hilgardii ATCC 27305]MCT3393010.1 energy-coupling factor transporter transmembrane protein EcfT [Lentilactobacillus hilgardii]MCT3398786.1 energy-coupling factor transporter transmembrane protein EcfT [Lentilactobacillus hilgardii]MCV3740145.1 energy-